MIYLVLKYFDCRTCQALGWSRKTQFVIVTKKMEKSHLRILLRLLLLSLIVCVIITPCIPAADNEAGKSNTSTDNLVLTPGGYRPESKAHEIKPGESLRMTKEGHLQKIGPSGEVLEDYGVPEVSPADSTLSTH